MSELDDIRAEINELRSHIHKKRTAARAYPIFNFRVSPEEADLIDAACRQRGVCRSDLIRIGLATILQTIIPIDRNTPPELRRWINRRKARYLDPKADLRKPLYAQIDAATRLTPSRDQQAAQALLSDVPAAASILNRNKMDR